MQEPELHDQAFPYRSSERGYHFVQYPEEGGRYISRLMTKHTAESYAKMFNGTVHLHSKAPFRIRHAGKLRIFMLASCLVLLATAALADDNRPLTRDEPIVRMVLQEAANEPFPGLIAVAGVALDRVEDDRWPDNPRDVVYQAYQFTGMQLRIRRYTVEQIKRARIAVEIARTGTRPCGRLLWYHTTWVNPVWASYDHIQMKCQIGEHIFYGDQDDEITTGG